MSKEFRKTDDFKTSKEVARKKFSEERAAIARKNLEEQMCEINSKYAKQNSN